jgi:hypothetical protein
MAAAATAAAGPCSAADSIARVLTAAHAFDALGLPAEAAEAGAVKTAYRKAALQCHPDKSDDPRAEQAFKQLAEAYEVLLDPEAQAELLRQCRADQHSGGDKKAGGRSQPRQRRREHQSGRDDGAGAGDGGPHTTVYFRSAHDEREAARAAAAEKKRQHSEREQAAHRAEMEAQMQTSSWASNVSSWQSWAGSATSGGASKRRRGNAKQPDPAKPPPTVSGNATGVGKPSTAQRHVCLLCRRQFKEPAALERHEQQSELHQENLRKRNQQAKVAAAAAAAAQPS